MSSDRLRRIAELEEQNLQLRTALESRIVIEQAKGVLAERLGIEVNLAFELLRRAARNSRKTVHGLAAEVVGLRHDPAEITAVLPLLPMLAATARGGDGRSPGRSRVPAEPTDDGRP